MISVLSSFGKLQKEQVNSFMCAVVVDGLNCWSRVDVAMMMIIIANAR
jgi:hypothetical protein